MLRYKHIVFDFGNVIAKFDKKHILRSLGASEQDIPHLEQIIFQNWSALDNGTMDYGTAMASALHAPSHLVDIVHLFFVNWYKHQPPLMETWKLVYELKERNIPIYLLSNAPAFLSDHADYFEIFKEFDGLVFSGPLKCTKPEPAIYQYLFDTYHLNPNDCFFIDDNEENIAAGKKLGMNGIVFTGDTDAIRLELGLSPCSQH